MSDERGQMTPQELDELASAYLDGEATAEETALVESDPRLQARVEELRTASDLVAAPVDAPSDEVRDQMIAQALDHRAPVVSLETARRRLRVVPPQARVILAAAAVVAAIAVVGVTVFNQATQDGDQFADDMATSADAPEEPAMEMSADAPVPESAESQGEPLAGLAAPDSADAAGAEAPAEAMMEEEMAIELDEVPMDDSDGAAEDADEAEPLMDAESADLMEASGENPLEFVTEADLFIHVAELVTVPEDGGPEELADSAEKMGCPQPLAVDAELLTQFAAVVEHLEVEVSVYESDGELLVSQTTPPPECSSVKPLTPLP